MALGNFLSNSLDPLNLGGGSGSNILANLLNPGGLNYIKGLTPNNMGYGFGNKPPPTPPAPGKPLFTIGGGYKPQLPAGYSPQAGNPMSYNPFLAALMQYMSGPQAGAGAGSAAPVATPAPTPRAGGASGFMPGGNARTLPYLPAYPMQKGYPMRQVY